MCKDCGCSITDHEHTHEHHHEHDHDHHGEHHHHDGSHEHQHAHETLNHNPQLNDPKTISVIKKILDKNDHEAEHNRAHFDKHNVLGINLMSSPWAEKQRCLNI